MSDNRIIISLPKSVVVLVVALLALVVFMLILLFLSLVDNDAQSRLEDSATVRIEDDAALRSGDSVIPPRQTSNQVVVIPDVKVSAPPEKPIYPAIKKITPPILTAKRETPKPVKKSEDDKVKEVRQIKIPDHRTNPVVIASDQVADPAVFEDGRKAYFFCPKIPRDLENPIDVMLGNEITQVTLAKRSIKGSVRIPADGIIKVVRQIENYNDPANPSYDILAQAVVSKEIREALILLIPADQAKSEFLFDTKVIDLATFTGGDYLFVNVSPAKIGIKMGEKKINLGPMQVKAYAAGDIKEATNIAISYHWYHPGMKRWRRLSASTVVMRPTRREIIIFAWDAQRERVAYHNVTFPVK